MPNSLAIVGNDHAVDDKTPVSDHPDLLNAVEREIFEELHVITKAVLELSQQNATQISALSESVQSLHNKLTENTEADKRFRESCLRALSTLTDWVDAHKAEHQAEGAHRAKLDSVHEITDESHAAAIHKLEVDKANLAAQVAQHEAKLAQMWALRGKIGAVIGALISIGEIASRVSGAGGLIDLVRSMFGGH